MAQITAYGTPLDREKLRVLATLEGKSQSEWIVDQIRRLYFKSFGDIEPDRVVPPQK
ncbi:hypothetical protein IZ6_24920 [Terrihabitans soli]|uniref:Ribbon-helix-helix protein, CopG family n=1 Tax=Terrihabitans soli TaxID=708113 RepID=A0A6S6QV13_9HYPH|nr:hypothetical protein IZ6_24920 [Terrihabitans soli]